MSFNFLGAMASLLPGYIQGRRQAIQDNWQDQQNFNNILGGQLNNMWNMATWGPRLDMYHDAANRSWLQLLNDRMTTNVNLAGYPEAVWRGWGHQMTAPQRIWNDEMFGLQAQQLMARNPSAFIGGMGGGQAPSQIGR